MTYCQVCGVPCLMSVLLSATVSYDLQSSLWRSLSHVCITVSNSILWPTVKFVAFPVSCLYYCQQQYPTTCGRVCYVPCLAIISNSSLWTRLLPFAWLYSPALTVAFCPFCCVPCLASVLLLATVSFDLQSSLWRSLSHASITVSNNILLPTVKFVAFPVSCQYYC